MSLSIAGAIGAAVGSAALQSGQNFLNTAVDYNLGKRASNHNFNRAARFQAWQAKELPSLQVEGLKKAGINPIVAYGNIGSVSGGSGFSQDMPHTAAVSQADILGGLSSREQRRLLEAQFEHQRFVDEHTAKVQDRAQDLRQEALDVSRLIAEGQSALNKAKADDITDQVNNREKYLDNLTRSYIGNHYFGRLFISDLIKLLKFGTSANGPQTKIKTDDVFRYNERYWEKP